MIPTASLLELAKGISGLSRVLTVWRKRKVLVVEDHEWDVVNITRIIQDCGFEVEVCATAEEALALLRHTRFHRAYVDLNLPRMNGWQFSPKAWEKQRDLQIIYTTGCAPTMQMMPKGEATTIIWKDVTKQSIESTLRNGSPTASDIALFWLLMLGAFALGKGWLGHLLNVVWQLGP